MRLFDLYCKGESDKEVVIKDDCERELFKGKFNDVSMKYGCFEVCNVFEEDGIMIVCI